MCSELALVQCCCERRRVVCAILASHCRSGALALYHCRTVGYLSFGPIEKYKKNVFCDLSVREKDWRSRARGAKATSALSAACREASWSDTCAASLVFERIHNMLSHTSKQNLGTRQYLA